MFSASSQKLLVKHVADADEISEAYLFVMKYVPIDLWIEKVLTDHHVFQNWQMLLHYGSDDTSRRRGDFGMRRNLHEIQSRLKAQSGGYGFATN